MFSQTPHFILSFLFSLFLSFLLLLPSFLPFPLPSIHLSLPPSLPLDPLLIHSPFLSLWPSCTWACGHTSSRLSFHGPWEEGCGLKVGLVSCSVTWLCAGSACAVSCLNKCLQWQNWEGSISITRLLIGLHGSLYELEVSRKCSQNYYCLGQENN